MRPRCLAAAPLLAVLASGCADRASAPPAPTPGDPPCRVTPLRAEEDGTDAFADVNRAFHAAHARARDEECRAVERSRLVIRYGFGAIEARLGGKPLTSRATVLPPEYHVVKDVAHAVFLATLLFDDTATDTRDHAVNGAATVRRALAQLRDPGHRSTARLPVSLRPLAERLLVETDRALTDFLAGRLDASAQDAYLARVRPDLVSAIHAMAEGTLRGLDVRVAEIRRAAEERSPGSWDRLLVIVAASHQARARELGVQYFERLLGERMAEGARGEHRLIVTEGPPRPAEQHDLLAAHAVDRRAAERILGDPDRLQWDLLGDDAGALDRILPPR